MQRDKIGLAHTAWGRSRIGLGTGQPGRRPGARHVLRRLQQSGIGHEFSLEGMLDSFTQRKSVTVNLPV